MMSLDCNVHVYTSVITTGDAVFLWYTFFSIFIRAAFSSIYDEHVDFGLLTS